MTKNGKQSGVFLNVEEVKAIVKEMEKVFISRENPLCYHVISQMIWFLREEEENVGKN